MPQHIPDHFSFKMSKHIFPCMSTLGWKHGVSNLTVGALKGYSEVKASDKRKVNPSYDVPEGPCKYTSIC